MSKFNAGQSFADGDTVTGAKLNNIAGLLDIYTGLISEQTAMSATVSTADQLLIADVDNGDSGAANRVTVQKLLNDTLTNGTFTGLNLTGTITSNRTVATSATITTGTIPNLTSSTANITLGTIPTLTAGTTTGTAGIFTSGTVATLNSTTGTIGNLSTTLAGDLTISQGTATLSTTGATAATYGTTSAIPVLTVDAKGRVTSGTSVTNPVGFRNRIINGDMRIDQRSFGTAYSITTGAVYGSCDRWGSISGANGVWSQQRVTTGSTDFPFATRVQRTAGSTSTALVYVGQVIETTNCQDLAGQAVTLSFYATAGANFSATSSLINVNLDIGTGSDQGWSALNAGTWTGYSAILNTTQAITATRTRYSFTTTISSGINEIAVRFAAAGSGTAGANDYFEITGVQLEAGSNATDLERRPIGTELALCYRYLPFFTLGNTTIGIIGQASATNTAYYTLPFQTTARTSPTGITLTTGTLRAFTAALATAGGTGAFNSAQTTQGQIIVTGSTGLVAGNATYLNPSASMTILWTGCEL